MGTLSVVVGGQFGSCGKGHIAGYLTRTTEFGTGLAIRVAGGNAGHSVVDPNTGLKYALRQVPVAAVTNPHALLGIAAGSEIDGDVLEQEILHLETNGIKIRDRLLIDPAATVVEPHHLAAEQASGIVQRIGSTGKGIGAARASRINRQAATVGGSHPRFSHLGAIRDVATLAAETLRGHGDVLVEGTQGYGLGLHTPWYPRTTSSDCRAIDFLAMAGVSPWQEGVDLFRVWLVVRPYPIRVAGDSGPLLGETTWEALGLPEEITTVTKKIRRVGAWDPALVAAAVQANGGRGPHLRVALTMADQIQPDLAGMDTVAYQQRGKVTIKDGLLHQWANTNLMPIVGDIHLITTSPSTVVDLR